MPEQQLPNPASQHAFDIYTADPQRKRLIRCYIIAIVVGLLLLAGAIAIFSVSSEEQIFGFSWIGVYGVAPFSFGLYGLIADRLLVQTARGRGQPFQKAFGAFTFVMVFVGIRFLGFVFGLVAGLLSVIFLLPILLAPKIHSKGAAFSGAVLSTIAWHLGFTIAQHPIF